MDYNRSKLKPYRVFIVLKWSKKKVRETVVGLHGLAYVSTIVFSYILVAGLLGPLCIPVSYVA